MLHQAGMEQRLSAEQGHGVEERGEEPVHLLCGLWGAPGKLELVGWWDKHDVSKLAYLASKVNTDLQSLGREGIVP